MKSIVIVVIGCFCLTYIVGCQGKRQQHVIHPTTPKEVYDKRVTVSISRLGETNQFVLTAKYSGKLDMLWWIKPDADLLDTMGKFVPRPKGKAGTGWFHWKEDDESTSSHFGDYRRGNPLTETLMLDMKELAPGEYRAVPSIRIFERGKDAHPRMSNPYYRDINGIRSDKIKTVEFTVK